MTSPSPRQTPQHRTLPEFSCRSCKARSTTNMASTTTPGIQGEGEGSFGFRVAPTASMLDVRSCMRCPTVPNSSLGPTRHEPRSRLSHSASICPGQSGLSDFENPEVAVVRLAFPHVCAGMSSVCIGFSEIGSLSFCRILLLKPLHDA